METTRAISAVAELLVESIAIVSMEIAWLPSWVVSDSRSSRTAAYSGTIATVATGTVTARYSEGQL